MTTQEKITEKYKELVEHTKCAFVYQHNGSIVEYHEKFKALESDIAALESQVQPEETDKYPDTEADGYVFCGKCGKMK